MTVIAAYNDGERIWIGSDSAGTADELQADTGSKLIQKFRYVIGHAISYRVADIIRESKNFPKNINNLKDLATFRNILKEELAKDLADGLITQEDLLSELLIISPYGIFVIEDGFQIHKIFLGYYAIGGGAELAFGALSLANQLKLKNGKKVVTAVVAAAIKHCTSCGGKCYVRSMIFLG